jgi:hypothetical protein
MFLQGLVESNSPGTDAVSRTLEKGQGGNVSSKTWYIDAKVR